MRKRLRRVKRTLRLLAHPMPVYVTRKDADGRTGTLSLSIWMALLVLMVVALNAILWGAYGIAQAVGALV